MIAVCIPWTGGHLDKWRHQAMRACVDHWHDCGWPVFLGGSVTRKRGWPNRSAARNAAIRDALNTTASSLLLVDADTEVPAAQVRAAAELAEQTGRIVYPYDDFMKVGAAATTTLMRRPRPDGWQALAAVGSRHGNPCSGALVVPVDVVAMIGGFDERYTAWGCEDRCFLLAAEACIGPARRVPGPAWHWWHPRAVDKGVQNGRGYELERDLARRYVAAAGYPDAGYPAASWPKTGPASQPASPDRAAMWAILTEPGGPLSSTRA